MSSWCRSASALDRPRRFRADGVLPHPSLVHLAVAGGEAYADGVLVPRHDFDLWPDDCFVEAHVRDRGRRGRRDDGWVVFQVDFLFGQPDRAWPGDCLFYRAVHSGCR